jgi:hypothetical protein
MKKNLLLLLFCGLSVLAKSQTDSLERVLYQYNDTSATIIKNGRRLLIEKVSRHDTKGIIPIVETMSVISKKSEYVAFYNAEAPLLYFWCKQSLGIIENQAYADIQPNYNNLAYTFSKKIANAVFNDYLEVQNHIKSLNINEEERDFLLLYLEELLIRENAFVGEESVNIKKIKGKVDSYKMQYPQSRFVKILNYSLPTSTVQKNAAYSNAADSLHGGLSVDLGGGPAWFSGKLNEHFSPNYALSLGTNFKFNHWVFGLSMLGSYGNLRSDSLATNSVMWLKAHQITTVSFGLTGGYAFIDTKRNHTLAFAGITSSTANSSASNNSIRYETLSGNKSLGLMLGAETNFLIPTKNINNEPIYWLLKLRYTYLQNFWKDKINGAEQCLSLSGGFFFGG